MWPTKMIGALPGHEHLTMGDQMTAAKKSESPYTKPSSGEVVNPRREFLKNRIQYRANRAASAMDKDAKKDVG